MILPCLFIASTERMDRGVYTSETLPAGTVIEISPVIVMQPADRIHLDQTPLHDYIFEWGEDSSQCIVALGYLSIYNHDYSANCEYDMDFDNRLMQIRTVREVPAGYELFINYNGSWDDKTPLWFDAS